MKTINTIDQDFRTRRNLFVHAGWYSPKGKLTRQKKTVKFLKPQSFQPLTLSTNSRVEVKIQEVRALRNAVLRAVKAIVYQAAFVNSFDTVKARGVSFQEFLNQAGPPRQRKRVRKNKPGVRKPVEMAAPRK